VEGFDMNKGELLGCVNLRLIKVKNNKLVNVHIVSKI